MKVKSESEVAQSCLTVRDPVDCSLPGSSVHGIFQARVLEWGAIALVVGNYGWSFCGSLIWRLGSLGFSRPLCTSILKVPELKNCALLTQRRTIYLKSEQTINYLEIIGVMLVFLLSLIFHPKIDFVRHACPAVWRWFLQCRESGVIHTWASHK